MASAVEDGFFLPADWARHTRCWMAWPCRQELWGDRLGDARDAHAEIANTIAQFEPVTMIANPDSVAEVSLKCGASVSCVPMLHDDSWLRDNGPSFLIDGRGGLAGVDWRFNGWGNLYTSYQNDAAVAEGVLDHLGARRYAPALVLEGGSYQSDGEGTLLVSAASVLHESRNPDIDKTEIERHLKDQLGAESVVWVPHGLVDDETGGQLDNVACLVGPAKIIALTTSDTGDVNHDTLQENVEHLRSVRDAKGRAFEVIAVEQPRRMENDDGVRLVASYVSLYIANGGVIVPSFLDPKDEAAYEAVVRCFPDRQVVQVPALDVIPGGGGFHGIAVGQPDPGPVSAGQDAAS